jgi:hypothetical protein
MMKTKKLTIAILLTICLAAVGLSACGGGTDAPAEPAGSTPAAPAGSTPAPEGSAGLHDKGNAAEDEITLGNRIVILQNAGLDAAAADYFGESKDGVAIQAVVDKFFQTTPEGDVKLVASDDYESTVGAADFLGGFIEIAGDDAPLFWFPNLEKKASVKTAKYALTAEGESIYYPTADISGADLLGMLAVPADATTSRWVATDDFYLEVTAEEMAAAELKVGLDGTVNGSLGIKKAGGKINDVAYIEIVK